MSKSIQDSTNPTVDRKAEMEENAERIRPQLKDIHPDLSVIVEKRTIQPLKGESYLDWVLLFQCRNIKFSSEGIKDINSVRKIFLDTLLDLTFN